MELSFKVILSTTFFASVSVSTAVADVTSSTGTGTGSGSSLKTLESSSMTAAAGRLKGKNKGIPKGDEFSRTLKKKKGKGDKDGNLPWIQPNCDWDKGETFLYDGENGRCEVQSWLLTVINDYAPEECNWAEGEIFTFTHDGVDADGECAIKPTKPEWYSLEEGTCSVLSCNETHLEFNIIEAETGILFSASPFTFILDPQESNEFGDLNHFKDESVGVLIKGEDLEEEILFVGVLENVSPEGNGMVRGKRLHGDDITPASSAAFATQSFVLGSVAQLRTWSAVALGMCTSDGNGLVSIEVEEFVGFKKGMIDPSFYMEFFKDVNAAIYSKELGFEVFNINEVGSHPWVPGEPNRGTITGEIFYSTKIGTWESPLGLSSSVTEKCFIFVDDQAVPTDQQVLDTLQAGQSICSSALSECSLTSWPETECLGQGCACSFTSKDCGKDMHCTYPTTANSKWSYFDEFNIFDWDQRYCYVYEDFDKFVGIMVAVAAVVVVVGVIVATGGLAALPAGGAAAGAELAGTGGTAAIVEGESMTGAELFAWIQQGAGGDIFTWAGENSAGKLTREALRNMVSDEISGVDIVTAIMKNT